MGFSKKKKKNTHINNNHNYVANGNVVSNCHGAKAKQLYDILIIPSYKWTLTTDYGLSGLRGF